MRGREDRDRCERAGERSAAFYGVLSGYQAPHQTNRPLRDPAVPSHRPLPQRSRFLCFLSPHCRSSPTAPPFSTDSSISSPTSPTSFPIPTSSTISSNRSSPSFESVAPRPISAPTSSSTSRPTSARYPVSPFLLF